MKHRVTSFKPGWNSADINGGGTVVVVVETGGVETGGVETGGVVVVCCGAGVIIVCVGVATEWHPGFKHSSLEGFVGWKTAGKAISPPLWQARQFVNPQSTSCGIVFTRSSGTEVRPQAASPRTSIKSPEISKHIFKLLFNLPASLLSEQSITTVFACFHLIVPDRMFFLGILFGDSARNPGCKGWPVCR